MRRIAAVLLLSSLLAAPGVGRAQVPNPTVTGPVAGGIHGHALFDSWYDLGGAGYQEAEYFVSGTATGLTSGTTAPYKTRILVEHPVSAERFNGTVLLDWVNVTAQFENAVDTLEAHRMLIRDGYGIVDVSAQAAGLCCSPLTPEVWDPVRYGSLSHPGDDYAFDIFSQVAQAVKHPQGTDPMDGLRVTKIIAAGQSQSASELFTYVTKVQPSAGVIDGFLIHGGGSKTWPAEPSVPVLQLFSDEEASPADPNITSANYRLWEVAGTAHSDFWLGYYQVFGQGPRTLADAPQQPTSADAELAVTAGNYGEVVHPMDATCILAGATMPMRYAVSAAIGHLDEWVRDGTQPPAGQRFAFSGTTLAKDTSGNTLGGIRLPPVDVPVATYVSTVCALGGITVPFSDVQLRTMYPTHAGYYAQMASKTAAAVSAGFMLPDDAADLLTRACAAKVRWGEPPSACP